MEPKFPFCLVESEPHPSPPGSIPGIGVTCGSNLFLVLVLAPKGFASGAPVSDIVKNQNVPPNPATDPQYVGHKFIGGVLNKKGCSAVFCRGFNCRAVSRLVLQRLNQLLYAVLNSSSFSISERVKAKFCCRFNA